MTLVQKTIFSPSLSTWTNQDPSEKGNGPLLLVPRGATQRDTLVS